MEPQEIQPTRRRWLSGRLIALSGVLLAILALYYALPNVELLFDWEALQRFRVEREYARLDKERSELTVDKSSPVYHFAKALGGKSIIQCDGTPSVSVGGQRGYRILYRSFYTRNLRDKNKSVMPTIDYMDIVLFPSAPQRISAVKAYMTKIQYPSSVQMESYYLGEGEGYFWFVNDKVQNALRFQNNFHLKNGEDLMPAMLLAIKHAKDPRERSSYLHDLGRFFGERAIPELMRIVETPETPSDRREVSQSLAWIPGPQATKALLEIYDKYGSTVNVPYALISHKPREGAKRVYLEMLSSDSYYRYAVEACLEFHWTEAVPFIKAQMEHPYMGGRYAFSGKALRVLEGNPIPDSLSKIEELIWDNAGNHKIPFNSEEYVRQLLEHEDQEAVLLVGIELAFAGVKMGGSIHKCGEEVLRRLPKSLVMPVLVHLAINVRDEHGGPRRAEKLLELVRDAQ